MDSSRNINRGVNDKGRTMIELFNPCGDSPRIGDKLINILGEAAVKTAKKTVKKISKKSDWRMAGKMTGGRQTVKIAGRGVTVTKKSSLVFVEGIGKIGTSGGSDNQVEVFEIHQAKS